LVIALVVTLVLAGNTADNTTQRDLLAMIEASTAWRSASR